MREKLKKDGWKAKKHDKKGCDYYYSPITINMIRKFLTSGNLSEIAGFVESWEIWSEFISTAPEISSEWKYTHIHFNSPLNN